jgi:DNA-binding transcriptional MerR regulator
LIRGALSIGFSVRELAAILDERDHGGAPCQRVRKLAAEKLVALEARLRDLQSWRRVLRKTLADWDRVLRKTPRGKRAGLLEAFVATHPIRQKRISRFDALARGNRKREKQQ